MGIAGGGGAAHVLKPKLTIFCDGTNFLASQREAGIHYRTDIPAFARALARKPPGYVLNKLRFYSAPSPHTNPAQQRLYEALRRANNVELILGRHEARAGGAHHVEKETDVHLAVDLVVGAYQNHYDVAMLVSGDTDFVPAVRAVREIGKKVIWCYFATQHHSEELRQACDSTFLLNEPFLRTCQR